MAWKLTKLFFLSVFVWIVLLLGLIPGVFFVYNSGLELINELEFETRSRSTELASTIGTLAQESEDPASMVALCQTMNAIVNGSSNRAPTLAVTEAFFINREGKVLAHNEIAKVASQSSVVYDEKKYLDASKRWMRNPVLIEPNGSIESIDNETLNELMPLLQEFFPELLINRYHASFVVYPPDEIVPSGSVHLMLENNGLQGVLISFLESLISVAIISVAVHFFLWILFTIFGAVAIFKNKTEPTTALAVQNTHARMHSHEPENRKVERAPEPVAIESKESSEVVILDAIPLELPERLEQEDIKK